MSNCVHCKYYTGAGGGCSNPDEECHFVPTQECRGSEWWKWAHSGERRSSGVYIKNFELPESCEDCRMMCVDKTGELTYCVITRRVVRWWMHDRHESSEGTCPLAAAKKEETE